MRWTRLLLLIFAAVLLVVGAGLVFLLTLDVNDYKHNIERFVESETGRAFVIDGRIDLDLGQLTGLTMTDVRFGNPDWAGSENMARVGRASVVLDLRSLLSGPVIVELVELDNAELNLEQRKSGENNWTFGAGSDESGGDLVPLILRQAHVANFALTVTTPALDSPLEIRINRLEQVQKSDGLFDAKLRGTLNDRTVNVTGEYGPLESLLAAQDLTVDIAGQFDTLSITATGLIDNLVRPRRPRIGIEIAGPDIDHITGMLGLPDLGGGDLDLKISLQPGMQDVAVSIAGRVGEHEIESGGSVSDLIAFEQVSMRVSAHGPDLNEAARLFGAPQIPAGPYQLSGSVNRDGPRLDLDEIHLAIGAAKFRLDGLLTRFPDLNDANLSLEVHGEHVGHFTRLFGLPGVVEGPFRAIGQLEVAPDGIEVMELAVATQIVELTLTGAISKGPDLVGTRANVTGRGANIAAVAAALDVPMQATEPFEFEGDIELGQNVVFLPGDATFTVGDNRLVATGVIGFEPLGNDTDLRVRIKGPDLAQVAAMAGVTGDVPATGYEASGRFRTPPEGYRIDGLQARIGEAEFTVDGMVSRTGDFVGTQLKIDATVPELGDFIADTETLRLPDGPFGLSGKFELLADALRLTGIEIQLGGATGSINADIGLPIASATGAFDVRANGASFQAVFPDTGPWEPPDMPFEIRAQGKFDDGLLHIKPVTIQLGDAHVTAEGVFDLPPNPSRTNLTITARAASLATIGTFNERPLPDMNFSLDAKFAGTPQSFSIEDLAIMAGDSDMTGSIIVQLDRAVPDVSLTLQSNLLDVTPLLETSSEVAKAFDDIGDDAGAEPAGDGRLIPEWTLPLEKLTAFNAVIDIDIDKYRQYLREIDHLVLDAVVRDGLLDVERASGATASGSVSATFDIVPTDDSAMVHATFEGEDLLLGFTKDRTRDEIDSDPKFGISVALDGAGLTLRDIAANLNGQIKVSSSEGRMENTALRFFYGDFFGELLTALNPFAKTAPYTEISCIMVVVDIENGLFDADPGMALQTDKMNIISGGTIDLRTEKLDFNFRTAPRKKISISAGEFINPYIKVAGMLADPRLTLDPTGTLVTGSVAVATVGMSLLAKAVWDRVFAAGNPCAEVVKQAEKKRKQMN